MRRISRHCRLDFAAFKRTHVYIHRYKTEVIINKRERKKEKEKFYTKTISSFSSKLRNLSIRSARDFRSGRLM